MIDENKYKLLIKMRFNNYPTHFIASNKVRPKYIFKTDKNILKKYSENIGLIYDWDDNDKLFNIKTGEYVIANYNKAGQPNLKHINGQHIYNLTLKDYEKKKISDLLRQFYQNNLVHHFDMLSKLSNKKDLHIHISYVCDRNDLEDLDNHSLLYQKILFDSFLKFKYIKEGNKKIKIENRYGFLENDNVEIIKSFSINYIEKKGVNNYDNCMIIRIYQKRNPAIDGNMSNIITSATKLADNEFKQLIEVYPHLGTDDKWKEFYDQYFEILTN